MHWGSLAHAQKCAALSPNLAVIEGRRVAEKVANISPKKCESMLLQE